MTYITDHKWKNYRSWNEVPESVRSDFDWMGTPESSDFIMYRGAWYTIEYFMYPPEGVFQDCPLIVHGYASDSFYSGVVIELDTYGDKYRIATYIN